MPTINPPLTPEHGSCDPKPEREVVEMPEEAPIMVPVEVPAEVPEHAA